MQPLETGKLVRVLDWHRTDIEQRFGFKGGKYTDVHPGLAFLLTVLVVSSFYGILIWLRPPMLTPLFLERGPTPFFIALFSCWSLSILFVKWRKLTLQRKALELNIVPHSHDFALAPATATEILDRMHALVDDVKRFALLNRIDRALSNLSNIGMLSDVSEMLSAQAANDEDHMESSYMLVKGFIWGIPILGFIGTVLGLSMAIGEFGKVLGKGDSLDGITSALTDVTGGLSVAFDTTLIGLVAALAIQLTLTILKKKEEYFLDECKEYCHRSLISKLRLMPLTDCDQPKTVEAGE